MLLVHEGHRPAADGAKTGLARPEAVVGVLEVRLEVFREAADRVEGLSLQVRAGEDDPLDGPVAGVLPDVRLRGADLLAPDGVGKDVGARVEEPAVRHRQAAADDADVGGRVRTGGEAIEPAVLANLEVVVQEDDVRSGPGGGDPDVVSPDEAEVRAVADRPQPGVFGEAGRGLVRRAVVDDEDLDAVEVRVGVERLEAAPGERPAVPGQHDDRDRSRGPLPGRGGLRRRDVHAPRVRAQAARRAGSTSEATSSTESGRPSRRGAAKTSASRSSRSVSRRRRCSNGRRRARTSIRLRRSSTAVRDPSRGASSAVSGGGTGRLTTPAPGAGEGPAPPSRRRSDGSRRCRISRWARTARRWVRSASAAASCASSRRVSSSVRRRSSRERVSSYSSSSMRACGERRGRGAPGVGSGGAVGTTADYRERPPGGADGPLSTRRAFSCGPACRWHRCRCEIIGFVAPGDRGPPALRKKMKDLRAPTDPSR